MDSWDFSSTPSLSGKRSVSVSRSSLHPDDATDPVFELDEDRAVEKVQVRDDSEKSEDSSSGPPTPGPTTPVLVGLSSPAKDEAANRVLSVSPGDGPKPNLGYNYPNAVPVPVRVTRARNTSRSAPKAPTDPGEPSIGVPHSAPPEKTSQGSKLWSKWAKPGSSRGKKLNTALDKTGTLARVVSAGFSSKSSKS